MRHARVDTPVTLLILLLLIWHLQHRQKLLKCQKKNISIVYKMQENNRRPELPRIPLGSLYSASPDPLSGGNGTGCSKSPAPVLGLSGLGFRPVGPRLSPPINF